MILGAWRGLRILQRRPDNDDHPRLAILRLKPFSLEAHCRLRALPVRQGLPDQAHVPVLPNVQLFPLGKY